MRITVSLLLLAAVSHAAQSGSSKKQKNDTNEKTEKRELVEGNSGIEKRAPVFSTVSPAVTTAGVEYADTKEGLSDKSPSQQVYATPVPEIAKISDVLSGQGPHFQAAIANHLYSPISVYQPRFGSPTTYEVSQPVPSQLAYAEHRLALPSPNAIQFGLKTPKLSKPIVNYEQPQFIQPSYEQTIQQPIQPLYQQIPNNIQNLAQPIQYSQQAFAGHQQIQYVQQHPSQTQGGINYNQEQTAQSGKLTEQRDVKSQTIQSQNLQQDYNGKEQGAQSYASFTFKQLPSLEQNQLQKTLPTAQPQFQAYQQNQQLQPVAQLNYQLQHPSLQQSQYQPQQISQPQLHIQPQIQAQASPQLIQHQAPQPQIQYQSQNPQIQYQTQQPQQSLQFQAYQAQQQLQSPQPQIQYQQQLPQPVQYQEQQPQQIQYQEPQQIPYQLEQQPQFIFPQQQFQQPQLLRQQYQIQPQQYEIPQIQSPLFNVEKPEPKQAGAAVKPVFKQSPIYQPQITHTQGNAQVQDVNYKGIPALPTFPPVQYFGKFAPSLFGH